MNGKIIGLRFAGNAEADVCSEYMKRVLCELVSGSGATYDLLLYPYADALLLSEDGRRGNFFGSHAILWGFGAEELAGAVVSALGDKLAELAPTAEQLDCTQSAVAHFLAEGTDENAVGDFAATVGGSLRPWTIREAARRFCAFCECSVRVDGAELKGLSGGGAVFSASAEAMTELCELYRTKTGGTLA